MVKLAGGQLMKLIGKILGIVVFIILLTLGLVAILDIPFLVDPSPLLEKSSFLTATVAACLLVLDIFLPVPSSVIMIACGHLFGVAIGALVSFTGMMISNILGYYIGYISGSIWVNEKSSSYKRARKIMDQWGGFALILTRPIPILSESVVIIAGVEKMPLLRVLIASALGLAPICILYAIVGHYAASLAANVWSFVIVLALALLFMVFSRRKIPAGAKTGK